MENKVEISESSSTGNVTAHFDMSLTSILRNGKFNDSVIQDIKDRIVDIVADEVMSKRKQEIVAAFDVNAIVNLALAKIANKTAEEMNNGR